jgi:hypothetical protein
MLQRLGARWMNVSAVFASTICERLVKSIENGRQLRNDVVDMQILCVQSRMAAFAEPKKSVLLVGAAFAFHYQAYRVCKPLRRMRHMAGEEQDIACANRYIDRFTALHGFQQHFAFKLVEEFFARVVVIIAPRVGAAHDHDDKFGFLEDLPITNGWFEVLTVAIDPIAKVKRF